MSSADVVVSGTNAIANAYQGMIGAAADKKRRRMQSLLGIGQNLEDVVTQVKEAKEKRTEESESKALTEALSLGLRDGDPSKAIDTIAATSATSPRVAQAKASLLLKLMDDKRQVEQTRATLKLQADQFAAQEANRKADNDRAERALGISEANQKAINEDRDALRAINDANTKAQIKLKEDESSTKRVELTRKDRAAYDVGQMSKMNADLFTDSFDREKNGGLGRADTFAARYAQQSQKFQEGPEVLKAYQDHIEKLSLLDRKDKAIKEQAAQRMIEETQTNAKKYFADLDTAARAAAGGLKFAMEAGQATDPGAVEAAVMEVTNDPAYKRLVMVPGTDPQYLQALIRNRIMAELGGGKRELSPENQLDQRKLDESDYRMEKNIDPYEQIDNADFKSWLGQRKGQKPKVDPKSTNYETPLNSQEEAAFKIWKQKYAPDDSGEDYDLRGAFKAGLTPDPRNGHWPDTFKKPNHPTFSVESKYAKFAPEKAGSWDGERFIPPSGSRPGLDPKQSKPQTGEPAGEEEFIEVDGKIMRNPKYVKPR